MKSMNNTKSEMLTLVHLMAEYHDQEISDNKAEMLASDLMHFGLDKIKKSWEVYRKKPQSFKMPTVGQLIENIADGRPSAQESWAMIPKKDEGQSVVWTDEMRLAYGACLPLIKSGDITGAFFAYKEAYDKAVLESRNQGLAPRWSPSLGLDKSTHESALIEAVEKSRMSLLNATQFYPQLQENPRYEALVQKFGDKTMLLNSAQKNPQLEESNKKRILNLINTKKPGIPEKVDKSDVPQIQSMYDVVNKPIADFIKNGPSEEERKKMIEEILEKETAVVF